MYHPLPARIRLTSIMHVLPSVHDDIGVSPNLVTLLRLRCLSTSSHLCWLVREARILMLQARHLVAIVGDSARETIGQGTYHTT